MTAVGSRPVRTWRHGTHTVSGFRVSLLRLAKLGLSACAESGEAGAPELARRLVTDLGTAAKVEEHAQSLIACRRSHDLPSARLAWAALCDADGLKVNELCYAVMIGMPSPLHFRWHHAFPDLPCPPSPLPSLTFHALLRRCLP